MEDCLQLDINSLSYLTDVATRSKLHSALHRLGLTLWLEKLELLDYLPVLEKSGYSSKLSLCGVDAKQVRIFEVKPLYITPYHEVKPLYSKPA